MRVDRLNRLVRDGETLDGAWELASGHQLRYRRRGPEKEVILVGNLLSSGPNSLNFRLEESIRDEDVRRRELALRGRWQTDPSNRLTFWVERERGMEEALTLEGAWETGPGNEILYRFERSGSKGSRSLHRIRFEGVWEIGEDRRLSYVMDAGSDSAFRFRGTFQTASLRQKQGAVRYQIGLQVEGKKRFQTVTLFGKWKLSRDLSLEFEIPYSGGFRRSLSFGAVYAWDSSASVSARLTTPAGKPLGVELSLHKEFLQGRGEAFVRLRRSLEETAAEAGVRVRW